jgi:hypothetical protein
MRQKRPTFKYTIEGKDVVVLDDVVSAADHAAMAAAIGDAPCVRQRMSIPGMEHAKYWTVNYPNATVEALPLHDTIVEHIRAHFPKYDVRLARGYVNNNSFGDLLSIHPDSDQPGSLTAVYFVNDTWQTDWGGETMFYRGDEAVACVTPRPRRLVLFDASILHRGTPPMRSCYASRLVLAMKFERAALAPRPRTKARRPAAGTTATRPAARAQPAGRRSRSRA